MKRNIKLIAAVAVLTTLNIGIAFALPMDVRTQPASADISDKYDGDCQPNATVGRCADKLVCQYPARTTNTATTCDNSDPCDAANTKGNTGDCSPAELPLTTQPTLANKCGDIN